MQNRGLLSDLRFSPTNSRIDVTLARVFGNEDFNNEVLREQRSDGDIQLCTRHSSTGRHGAPLSSANQILPVPLTFLDTTIDGTVGFISSGWPVAYMIATVICGVSMLIGSLTPVSQSVQVARQSSVPSRTVAEPKTELVGRITGMVDCKWAGTALDSPGVPLGRKYELVSGLMEITYDTGAKVILQGPVTYEVESRNGGFLPVGKLTGKVENEKAKGFSVRTPTATVTDLGTEFGVEVAKSGKTTSHVFRGSVRVQVRDPDGKTLGTAEVLHENESARVENTGNPDGSNHVIVFNPSAEPVNFVREISKRVSKPLDRLDVVAYWQFDGDNFLADSSGHGHTLVNRGAKQVDNAASFDGTAMMSSVDPIDLTPYTKVRVSWRQKVASAASQHVIWEHDSNNDHSNQDNYRAGMIVVHLTDGKEYACIYTGNGGKNVVEEWNKKTNSRLRPTCGKTSPWNTVLTTDQGDRAAYRANVVKVFKDETAIATEVAGDGFAPIPSSRPYSASAQGTT